MTLQVSTRNDTKQLLQHCRL